ncbi:helix-turn-helix domain-containing protein [Paenibacillus senegalensis]|uniref:helix-turn-helix domain-containing protein n=1 Tax=Paenibacillus senegalensis TaxID=1465766 RepID=UPI000287CA4A|nr:AraC family transcriptional regulator [Paenibacillus senegalensis]
MPKYFYRLLLFTLLLAAVPVISIGTISFYIASRDIEKKVNEGNVQILLQNQMRMEQLLRNVEMGAVQYINSPLASDSVYDELTFDDFKTISNLSKGLYNLHSFPGVSETRLINLEHDWIISNLGFKRNQQQPDPEWLGDYAEHPQNFYWLVSDGGTEESSAAGMNKPGKKMQLVIKLPMIASSTEPKALLIVDMSLSVLENDLAQYTQWGSIHILNRERKPVLANPGSAPIPESVLTRLQTAEEDEGYFEDAAMAVNYTVSPHNFLTYVSVVSIDDMTRESRKIAVITANACLIIFILIAALAFYGSRRMYSPIRRLFDTLERFGEAGESRKRKDEFAFIEERFNALFSTRKQLQNQLHGQRGQMKEFFLLKLFKGQITESEFLHKSEAYGFAGKGKAMGVIALQIDSLHHSKYLESDRELLLFAINNIVGELVPPSCMVGSLLLEQSQVSLLRSNTDNPEELRAYFHETAEKIKTKVEELLQIKVSIGISRAFDRYKDAMGAYSQALEALKRRISLGNEIIISYDDIEEAASNGVHPSASWKQAEDDLINALKTGDSGAAFGQYSDYVALIMDRDIRFNDFQMIMIQLISRIYRIVQQQGGSLDGLLGSTSVMERFMKLHTVEEITEWFRTKLLPPVIAFLKGRIDTQYINIAHQMIRIIEEEYDQDITLESCAKQLKFHPVYLSRVFKKEVGVTFIEYLTEYRMNVAKTWLKESDLKITEIAERLNYTNSTGFIRTFRKITGMTPGQYRSQF